jgi:pyruvate dehydrogenase E2 component (dihydrolipoamide acetyltransferase)
MPTPFIMPKMDMDQEVVTIMSWLKKEGDRIEKGEPVIEVETDKIASEIEAPESGILANILYHENEEAPVTKVVAYILKEGETLEDIPAEKEKPVATAVVVEENADELVEKKGITFATPLAEKMAADLNIEISEIPGSSGKVTRKDIEAYATQIKDQVKPRVETPATPAARRLAEESGVTIDNIIGTGPNQRVQAVDVISASAQAVAPRPIRVQPEAGTQVPLIGKRKRTAERLTSSYQETPHIYLSVDVDMTRAESTRKRINVIADNNGDSPVSMTSYLIKVVAWALKRHPYLNSKLGDNNIVLLKDINIGVATAVDDGLIVPVIHEANLLSIQDINERLRYLSKQAREGSLEAGEVSGGTFTISNLGMYGIHSFTAIINPPQSAILAVGGLVRKPIVVDEQDTIEVRPMITLTLGADHRIVDGAVAAMFLSDLVMGLESPEIMLYQGF